MRIRVHASGLLLLLLPVVAAARPCTEAILECGHSRDVTTIKNAKALFQAGWSAARIHAHCRPSVLEPPGCEWATHPASAAPSGAGRTTVSSPQPSPEPESPPNRDNAKHGPTPAPRDVQQDGAAPHDGGIFADEIAAASQRFRLPAQLIRAVMMTESGGNPLVLSGKGAVGLMQLLPGTAKEMGVDDIHDVAQNIMGGARFLRVLANRFEGDLVKVLAAYHAGSTRVMGRDATPFAATDDYVRKVLRLYYQLRDAR